MFGQFWSRYPLLWIGLHILLGCLAASGQLLILFPICAVLWIPFRWQRFLSAALLVLSSWYSASFYFSAPSIPEKGWEGTVYFSISQIKLSQTPFGSGLCYRGSAYGFFPCHAKIPCQILLKESSKRPLGHCDYLIHGKLIKSRKGNYVFKPDRGREWRKVENTNSFAELRFQFKRKVAGWIKQEFGKTACSSLFASLATGDIDERTLAVDFSRLGLSHILAISGFHFALFAAFFLFFIKLFLPLRLAHIVTLFLVGAYLFFLGPCPSAMRACCAISLALSAKISGLRSSGINALGAGLAILLLLDPTLCQNLGFQLSFLCTAALLFLYTPCEHLLFFLFPKRTLNLIKTMTFFDQHGALLASCLRKILALTLCVHIVSLPVCLFYFSYFPLLGSLLYNLFFPFLLSLSLFLLLLSVILFPLAPLINQLNLYYTQFLLSCVSHAPPILKAPISFGPIHPLFLSFWLSSLLLFSILWQSRNHPSFKLLLLNLRAKRGQKKITLS